VRARHPDRGLTHAACARLLARPKRAMSATVSAPPAPPPTPMSGTPQSQLLDQPLPIRKPDRDRAAAAVASAPEVRSLTLSTSAASAWFTSAVRTPRRTSVQAHPSPPQKGQTYRTDCALPKSVISRA
jgi:hypothetical protein